LAIVLGFLKKERDRGRIWGASFEAEQQIRCRTGFAECNSEKGPALQPEPGGSIGK